MIAEWYLIELAFVVFVTLIVLWIMRLLKQPPLVGYILVGILAGPLVSGIITSKESFEPLAKVGISLLLFAVGLNLDPRSIKGLKKVALVAGIGQLIFAFTGTYLISSFLGFSVVESVFIGVALSFSSTIVAMKFLADREETETLHGRIAIGFLIVQDFIHALALIIFMSVMTIPYGANLFSVGVLTFLKSLLLGVVLVIFSIYVLPPITKPIARSQEMLFFFSITWAFALALVFELFLNSLEVGALVAGVTLSVSPFRYEISSKIKSIRDFLFLIFFIWLALQMKPMTLQEHFVPIIALSLFIVIGTPIIVMILMGILGYTRRNSFLTGLFVAQVSEFSFIIVAAGVKFKYISADILSLIIFVGIITIVCSSYLITHSHRIYPFFSERLKIFERKNKRVDEGKYHSRNDYDIILFGCNRIGYDLLEYLKTVKNTLLVVDYNPETTLKLAKSGIDSRYGDANDIELLDDLEFKKTKMVISTIPEKNTNIILLDKLRRVNKNAVFIAVAHHIEDALELYGIGATYVIMPHFLGGKHTASLIKKHGLDKDSFLTERSNGLKELRTRIKEGHRHPANERG
jgi:Kef-type K+ transport system membrane component KefB